jgi:quercetin dioxygenase-like cupin family protein
MSETPRIRIVRPQDAPQRFGAPIGFTAETAIHAVGQALGTPQLQINVLYFGAGDRTRPHIHPYDQILFYGSGGGIVALDGGEDERVEQGSFAILPASVVHMHGASVDGPAWHISMMRESSTGYDMAVPAAWRHWVA